MSKLLRENKFLFPKSYMRSAQLITQLKCNLDVNACVFCENKPESLNHSWLQSGGIQLPRLMTS